MKIIVIGGGIGGLSSALFLCRLGASVVVYEASSKPSASSQSHDMGIMLATNGLNVLASYSKPMVDELHSMGYPAPHMEIREPRGSILGVTPSGARGRHGPYGTIVCTRWDVVYVLLEECARVGVTVVYNSPLEALEESLDGVRVKLAHGVEAKADLVVGADGMRSIVRTYLLGDKNVEPEFQGLTNISGLVRRSDVPSICTQLFPAPGPKETDGRGAILTFGKVGAFGIAPVDNKTAAEGGRLMWWSNFEHGEQSHDGAVREKLEHMDVISLLKTRHGDWWSPVPEFLLAMRSSRWNGQYELDTLPTWHSDRIVLLGDSAHVMPPHSGQGAACALEDSAHLASVLKPFLSLPGDRVDVAELKSALENYEIARKPRIAQILYGSREAAARKRQKGMVPFLFMQWFVWVGLNSSDAERRQDEQLAWKAPEAGGFLPFSFYDLLHSMISKDEASMLGMIISPRG